MAVQKDRHLIETEARRDLRAGERGPSLVALLAVSIGLAGLVLALAWFVLFHAGTAA